MEIKFLTFLSIFTCCVILCSAQVCSAVTDCPLNCTCLGTFADCSNMEFYDMPKDLPGWVETLDMSTNLITNIQTGPTRRLPTLQELTLARNSISEMPILSSMNNLTNLNMAHNNVTEINPEAIETLPCLKTLDLSNNRLTSLKIAMFQNASNLLVLNLNNNRIANIIRAARSGSFSKLRELKLNRNNLIRFDKEIFKNMSNLRTLELSRNMFKHIEGLTFQGLENLSVLKMRQNSIQYLLDGAFWGLRNLIWLHLDHNKISHVTKGWLYGLDSLQHLSLAHNNIVFVGDGWEFCRQMIDLDLSYNKLKAIKKETLEHLSKLQRLRLDYNQISCIYEGAFNHTPLLKKLELNNNKISWTIEDINEAFLGLKQLSKFGLAGNLITSINQNAFVGLESLSKLDLSSNAIMAIQENAFSSLPELTELHMNTASLLCDCALSWFPDWLARSNLQVDVYCAYPTNLKGKLVSQVSHEDFICSPDDFPKPRITEDPVSQLAVASGNVTLLCRATSSAETKMTFRWRHNNEDLEENTQAAFGVDQTSRLFLGNLTEAHSGRYQCIVSNDFGTAYSRKVDLAVVVTVTPLLVKTPDNVTVKAGSTARLECAATGQPAPQIAWQKDGGNEFPAAEERRMHVMPTDDVFFIVNTKVIDSGVYTCTARNPVGFAVANASLTVLEAPTFVKKMEDKVVRVGEPIVLECMASGMPKPALQWSKDSGSLVMTDRHFFTAEDQLLIIMDTVVTDSGRYECEMTNTLGNEKGVSHLTVVPLFESSLADGDMTGVIIITVVCCAVGTSAIWVIIIYQTRKRLVSAGGGVEVAKTIQEDVAVTDLATDNKSERSSCSKDSGTGDSTERSHDDLLLPEEAVSCMRELSEATGEDETQVLTNFSSGPQEEDYETPAEEILEHSPVRTDHDRC